MTPTEIIKKTLADGVTITLAEDRLQVTGPPEARERWRSVLIEHKREIVGHLAAHDREVSAPAVTDSHPCVGCDHLEVTEIAGQPVAGCLITLPDESEYREEWRPIRHDTPCWRNDAGNLYHEETTWRSDT